LTKTEIKTLAQNAELDDNKKTVKVSRRDLAYVLSKKWNGGTTVAGTLIIANMVGIKIFATGGIGKIIEKNKINSIDKLFSLNLTKMYKFRWSAS
jgi:pseudouridine-5'-phosphate glycosidase